MRRVSTHPIVAQTLLQTFAVGEVKQSDGQHEVWRANSYAEPFVESLQDVVSLQNFSVGLARRLRLVLGRGLEGVTRNRRSKISKRDTELLNSPRLPVQTNEGIEKEWGDEERVRGETRRRDEGRLT